MGVWPGSFEAVPMPGCGSDPVAIAPGTGSGRQPRCGCASVRNRSTICGWCSSNAGRSDLTRGSEMKLCRGGGQLVAHSKELPYPQGSSARVNSPYRHDLTTFHTNGSTEAPN